MAYRIFSTLDNASAITSPVHGASGEIIESPTFFPAHFGNGVLASGGYARFPTRNGGVELISNSEGSISLWLCTHFNNGDLTGRRAVFSLYNDSGSHIIVFYDGDTDKFGFREGEVGEVMEASSRTITPTTHLLLSFVWDGIERRLYIDGSLAASQRQGAEFIPDFLTLGVVEKSSSDLHHDYIPFECTLDNLKVEDICRGEFYTLEIEGIPSGVSCNSFCRTFFETGRSAYLSSLVDNQRNSFLACEGSASSRPCILRTGGRSERSCYAEVESGASRASFISAPVSAQMEALVSASRTVDTGRNGHSTGVGSAQSARKLFITAQASASRNIPSTVVAKADTESARCSHIGCEGTASLERDGFVSGRASARSERMAHTGGITGTASGKGAFSQGNAGIPPIRANASKDCWFAACEAVEQERASILIGFACADTTRPSWMGGSLQGSSVSSALLPASAAISALRMAAITAGIPSAARESMLVAGAIEGVDWLEHLINWIETVARTDEQLAPIFSAGAPNSGASPHNWGVLRFPALRLIKSSIKRTEEEPDRAFWRADLLFEAVGVRKTGGAGRLTARLVRCVNSALRTGTPKTIAGPLSVSAKIVPAFRQGRCDVSTLALSFEALVTPAGALV